MSHYGAHDVAELQRKAHFMFTPYQNGMRQTGGTKNRLCCIAIGLVTILLAYGCSSSPTQLANVQGTVKLNGKPASRHIVTLLPVAEGGGWARGITNEQGQYSLKHRSGRPGAEPGEYRVTIRVIAPPKSRSIDKQTAPHNSDAATTPFRVRVAEEGSTLDFDLSSS